MMDLPKPFFQVVRIGDKVVMQLNAMAIATIQPTSAGTTLITMQNGDTIESGADMETIESAVSDALTKD